MGQIQKLSILASIGECKNLSKSLISLFFFFFKGYLEQYLRFLPSFRMSAVFYI